ncbi:MAG: DUF5050 domain-containing protein [Oscillospiraceae bacterium]|nr:DUF5050 domain-containing protein [Oscillospiraceae bacterium]
MKLFKLTALAAAVLILMLALSACSSDETGESSNGGNNAGQGSAGASGSTEDYLSGATVPKIGEITNPQFAYFRYNSNLYRMGINGSDVTQITELPTTDPIVFGDRIYYFVSEWTSGGTIAPNIRMIKTDGTDDMRLIDAPVRDGTEFRGHAVQGEWLYYGFGQYISSLTPHKIGEDREYRRIKQDIEGGFTVKDIDNGWLYYTIGGFGVADPGLWKIKTDGTDEMKIADGQFDGDLFFDGDFIYAYRNYAYGSSDHGVYRINKDGSGSEKVWMYAEDSDHGTQGLIVHDGYIYNVYAAGGSIALARTEARAGAERVLLDYYDDDEAIFFLLGASADRLYYRLASEIYSIAFDGSGRTKITDEIIPGQRVWPASFTLR